MAVDTLSATSLNVGAPSLGLGFLESTGIVTIPRAVSLWVGPNEFGTPAITAVIPNVLVPPLRVGSPYLSDPHLHTVYPYGGDMTGLPAEPAEATPFYREVNAIWPDLLNQRAVVSPARNGVNRETGQLLQGWEHVEQSMKVIFATPFHERILRRWVGSYVPYILGESYVQRVVTRFFWAISVSIDLWEPNYRIRQVYFMGNALESWAPQMLDSVSEFRLGHAIFRTEGIYRPRAHLGDLSPYQGRAVALLGGGHEMWDPALGSR